MELALQIIIGLFGVAFFALGIRSMFMPKRMAASVGLSTNGAQGLNEIRGVLGGFFFASVALLIIGLVEDETRWFLAVAIMMGAIVFGRIVGILADGFEKTTVPPLMIEIVIGSVLVASHFVLG